MQLEGDQLDTSREMRSLEEARIASDRVLQTTEEIRRRQEDDRAIALKAFDDGDNAAKSLAFANERGKFNVPTVSLIAFHKSIGQLND